MHEIPWSWGPDIYLDVFLASVLVISDVDLVVGGCPLDFVNLLVIKVATLLGVSLPSASIW